MINIDEDTQPLIEVICTECGWYDYNGFNTNSKGYCRCCGGNVVFIGENNFKKYLAKLFTEKFKI